jgi:hypothetical protein
MDIRNDMMEMVENFNTIDARYRQLWDSLVDSEDGITGEAYYNLKALGEVISPVFVADASRHISSNIDTTDNRFYVKRSY